MQVDNKTARTGILLALLAASGYAFFPIFTKLIYQYSAFSSLDIAGWRFMMAVPIFWVALFLRNHTVGNPYASEPLPRWRLMGLGFLLATGALAAFYGLGLIQTGLYVMLFRTYPAIVMIIAVFLGDPLPPRGWLALSVVILGVALMILDPTELALHLSPTYLVGIGVAFYNAAVIAVYNILQGRVIAGRKSKAKASAWTLTGSLLTLAPLMVGFGLTLFPNWQTFFSVLGLAIFCTVLPLIAIYEGISRIGAPRFVLIGSVEPLLALMLAYVLFGEVLSVPQLIGGLLILSSLVLLEVRLPRRKNHNRPIQPAAEAGD